MTDLERLVRPPSGFDSRHRDMLTLEEDDYEALGYGSPVDSPTWDAWANFRRQQQAEATKRYRATEAGKKSHREGMQRYRAAHRPAVKGKPGPKPRVSAEEKLAKKRARALRWSRANKEKVAANNKRKATK